MALVSLNDNLNCTQEIPSVEVVFHDMSRAGFVLAGIVIVLASFTFLIYIDEVLFLRKVPQLPSERKARYYFLLGLYPVFSWTSVLGLFIPRASILAQLVAICYLAICVYQFFELIVDYFGGKKKLFNMLPDHGIPLKSVPLGCFLCCFQDHAKLTRGNFLRMKKLVLQMAILHPFLMFVAAVLEANGSYKPGKIALDSAYLYITSLAGASTALAVWGLVMLYRLAKEPLSNYHITAKFFSTQVVLVLSNVQGMILILLAGNNVIKCIAPLVTETRGIELHFLMMVFEMFAISVFARIYYRRIQSSEFVPHSIEDCDTSSSTDPKFTVTCRL
ncbi:PREDICTED: organic solute transporter subunit alpha-like isoform X2 [Priapulus caudatus]|uniref:Organic solute transporter subunit alpha-like isoform X2 n=1 Tax=Priapulus caudatus TaxID=37621 RepID=A0ABM1ETV6_PRICU|nr:PREDICTED: organic solute transporter subunit alpha-like isoform X2 [Priapulus caudatus]